jgi:hypothetical protein
MAHTASIALIAYRGREISLVSRHRGAVSGDENKLEKKDNLAYGTKAACGQRRVLGLKLWLVY